MFIAATYLFSGPVYPMVAQVDSLGWGASEATCQF